MEEKKRKGVLVGGETGANKRFRGFDCFGSVRGGLEMEDGERREVVGDGGWDGMDMGPRIKGWLDILKRLGVVMFDSRRSFVEYTRR